MTAQKQLEHFNLNSYQEGFQINNVEVNIFFYKDVLDRLLKVLDRNCLSAEVHRIKIRYRGKMLS